MPDLWLFVVTVMIVYAVPGPDLLLMLQSATTAGRTRGLATAAGLAIARSAHVLMASLGLAALLRAAPTVFLVVKLVGAAYLVWVGVQMFRSGALELGEGAPPRLKASPWAYFRRGLLTNLLNPKALLFCSVLLPQFIVPHGAPIAAQLAVLGAIAVGLGLVFDAAISVAGDRIGRWLAGRPVFQRVQSWVCGSLLLGLGARVAMSRIGD